jgi:hypothetical protein
VFDPDVHHLAAHVGRRDHHEDRYSEVPLVWKALELPEGVSTTASVRCPQLSLTDLRARKRFWVARRIRRRHDLEFVHEAVARAVPRARIALNARSQQ